MMVSTVARASAGLPRSRWGRSGVKSRTRRSHRVMLADNWESHGCQGGSDGEQGDEGRSKGQAHARLCLGCHKGWDGAQEAKRRCEGKEGP